MKNTVQNLSEIIIQTATSQGVGNGFYLSDYKLIITNSSLIHATNEVIISGKHLPKTLAKVLFTDPVFDLAFIKAPESILLPEIKFADIKRIKEGDELIRVTHFYGLPLTVEKIIVISLSAKQEGVDLIQYTTETGKPQKGALLINQAKEIVGMECFFPSDKEKGHYALPTNILKQTLDQFMALSGETALRCPNCKQIISKKSISKQSCPKCKAKIPDRLIFGIKYEPTPTGSKIEEIIKKLNYEVAISRAGLNTWKIEEGSTEIRVRHDVDKQFIIADAVLCKIPEENKSSVYEYLLKENNYLKGLSFKLKTDAIILSMTHIHENDFHVHSAARQFKELFNKADDYDDILIEMGAIPLNDEE